MLIYEVLPYLYVLVGASSAALVEESLGKLCGLMLIAAALKIFQLRLKYRSDRLAQYERIDRINKHRAVIVNYDLPHAVTQFIDK